METLNRCLRNPIRDGKETRLFTIEQHSLIETRVNRYSVADNDYTVITG